MGLGGNSVNDRLGEQKCVVCITLNGMLSWSNFRFEGEVQDLRKCTACSLSPLSLSSLSSDPSAQSTAYHGH